MVRFGIRMPSLRKRIAARTSLKRIVRHSLGLKAPRGFGWFTNPRRALYNRIYNRTTVGCLTAIPLVVLLAVIGLVIGGCGPSKDEIAERDRALQTLAAENEKLKKDLSDVRTQLSEALNTPQNMLDVVQRHWDAKEYQAAIESADALALKHPTGAHAGTARRIASAARDKMADAERKARADAERERVRQAAAQKAADSEKLRELRSLLHRNLDGKGGGFIVGWKWDGGDSFVLVLDRDLYVPNSALAAAVTARSIFDSTGVPLPREIVFRDSNGNLIDRGQFSNVPSVP